MGTTSKAVTKSIIRNLEMNGSLDNHMSRLEVQRRAIKNTEDDDIDEEDEEEEEVVEVKKGRLMNKENQPFAHSEVYRAASCAIR